MSLNNYQSTADGARSAAASAAPFAYSTSHGGSFQQFPEPARWLKDPSSSLAEADTFGFRRDLVCLFYRVRNTLAVFNFFTIHCFNAMLNVEIWREYMATHGGAGIHQRTWFENLYIATLAAPLIDVLVRIMARNFLKLSLARAQTHAGLAVSLSEATPSLNTYALLVLSGRAKWIFVVMSLDILEICYSFYFWTLQSVKTEAMWIKLVFIILTFGFWAFDIIALYQLRRFLLDPLPPHMNHIFISWDVNRRFHWHSANNIFDIMLLHEDPHSDTFTDETSRTVRRRIAEWNEGEEAIAYVGEEQDEDRSRRESEAEDVASQLLPVPR